MIIVRHISLFMAFTDLLDFHGAKLRILFEIKKSFFSWFFLPRNKALFVSRLEGLPVFSLFRKGSIQ